MNSLDKRIQEIKEIIKKYEDEIQMLEENDSELNDKKIELNKKLSKLKKLSSFSFKVNEFNLLKKINLYKNISRLIEVLWSIFFISSIWSFGSIVSILSNSMLVFAPINTYMISLTLSIIVEIISVRVLKKIDVIHNTYCDAYYLNDELLDNEVYDISKISEISYDYHIQKNDIILKQCDNKKKMSEYKENIDKLNLLLKEIINYKDSLDEIINTVIDDNMPLELKEKMLVKSIIKE